MDGRKKAVLVVLTFFLLALGVRLLLIDSRPLHHDEGVNGYFVSNIVEGKGWKYDPENYHGPTLFYITALSFFLFGQNVFALRIVPVLFGSLIVLIPFLLRKSLGFKGIIASGFALAFSPALLYFSMFAIHETLFAFFSIASFTLLLGFVEERKKWMLFSGVICLAMLFATKEASFFIAPFILLLCLAYAWLKGENFVKAIAKNKRDLLISVIIFFAIYCILFTSFLQSLEGLGDSVKTLSLWAPRVVEEKGHEKPFLYYFGLLSFSEMPLLLGGILGICLAFWKRNALFSVFGVFFIGLFFGTSFVAYKTPWIVVNFLPVLALLFGFFVNEFFEWFKGKTMLLGLVLCIAFASIIFTAYSVNVLIPASEQNRLSYVQTTSEARDVLERVLNAGGKVGISIEGGSTWPIPWLLREKEVEYLGVEALASREFLQRFKAVIVDQSREKTVEKKLAGYERFQFELRPGMRLTAFIKGS